MSPLIKSLRSRKRCHCWSPLMKSPYSRRRCWTIQWEFRPPWLWHHHHPRVRRIRSLGFSKRRNERTDQIKNDMKENLIWTVVGTILLEDSLECLESTQQWGTNTEVFASLEFSWQFIRTEDREVIQIIPRWQSILLNIFVLTSSFILVFTLLYLNKFVGKAEKSESEMMKILNSTVSVDFDSL